MKYVLIGSLGFLVGWWTCFLSGVFGGKTLRYNTGAGEID